MVFRVLVEIGVGVRFMSPISILVVTGILGLCRWRFMKTKIMLGRMKLLLLEVKVLARIISPRFTSDSKKYVKFSFCPFGQICDWYFELSPWERLVFAPLVIDRSFLISVGLNFR